MFIQRLLHLQIASKKILGSVAAWNVRFSDLQSSSCFLCYTFFISHLFCVILQVLLVLVNISGLFFNLKNSFFF